MADQKYKIDIETTQSGDGAERVKAGVDALNASAEKNAEVVNPMREGWDDVAESQARASEQIEKTTESIEKQASATEKAEAAELKKIKAQSQSSPRAEITQVQDYKAQARSVDDLRSKMQGLGKSFAKANPRILKTAKLLGRGGIVFGGIKLVGGAIANMADKVAQKGQAIESFGDDMALVGSKGSGLVKWVGQAAQATEGFGDKVRMVLNPLGAYIDATRRHAAAKRRLAKMERDLSKALAKNGNVIAKAKADYNSATKEIRAYNNSKLEQIKIEAALAKALADSEAALAKNKIIRDAIADRRETEIDVKFDEEADKISDDDPDAAAKRRDIEARREKEKEALRRSIFRAEQGDEKTRLDNLEKQKKAAQDEFNKSKDLGRDRVGNDLLSAGEREELEKLRDESDFVLKDESGREVGIDKKALDQKRAAENKLKVDDDLRKKQKDAGLSGELDAVQVAEEQQRRREAIEQLDREIEAQKTRLKAGAFQENTRRISQSANEEDKRRDFATTQGRSERTELGKKIKNAEDAQASSGGDVASEASRLADEFGAKGKSDIQAGFEKLSKAISDGILDNAESAQLAPFLKKLNASSAENVQAVKSALAENNRLAKEISDLKMLYKNNLK